jgi:hypothetical protein
MLGDDSHEISNSVGVSPVSQAQAAASLATGEHCQAKMQETRLTVYDYDLIFAQRQGISIP